MKKRLGAALLGLAFALAASPAPRAEAAQDGAILEVKGNKADALRILKAGGYKAVELKQAIQPLPSVKIVAPAKARPGHMVVVKADVDKSKLPDNLIAVKLQWAVLVDGAPASDFLVWPDGTQIVFSASDEPSRTTVLLDVDCVFGDKKAVKVGDKDVDVYQNVDVGSPELAMQVIVVGEPGPPGPAPDPTPTPGPPPAPMPTPAPVFPDSKFGLSKFTYEAIKADAGMTDGERVALAAALAKSYDGVVQQIVAVSSYRNFATILTDTAKSNAAALTSSGVAPSHAAAFKKALGDKIYDLAYDKKTLSTADDLLEAWREISAGLKAVK